MSYTQFQDPRVRASIETTVDWLRWMNAQSMLHDTLPPIEPSCSLCRNVCNDGYDLCYDCNSMAYYLDGLILPTYSFEAGLESLVGTYKDGPPSNRWQAQPLGSLLYETLRRHGACINDALGQDPIYTFVPSDNEERGFEHLEGIIKGVQGQWKNHPWERNVIVRDREHPRPARKRVQPRAYKVTRDIDARSVLLFDDLWTTGASMASAAARLKSEGAGKVIGVVLGRQLNPDFQLGAQLTKEAEERGWTFDECALCP